MPLSNGYGNISMEEFAMTENEIRSELRQVRYYHLHKKHLDIQLKNGTPNQITHIIKKYNRMIKDAPIMLYHIYVGLYIWGQTQEALAFDMDFTTDYISKCHKKLIKFFFEKSLE